ncbi:MULTISPECIES: glutamate racemase [Commensalibacter]|uniref:Glutamate racemase n=2 Tax=Commensalibacter TaxID=1079922 RepID=W7E4Y7_9PROT|nr:MULTISPECIES: glutamate racemase [Commensalibacter]EUK18136.1 glutamate racemase [Commensalibacter papalotli (ex Servin-Garciduenas et al. 2014)]CAI3936777.1 Glutamate racemase (MurI) (PDB:1B73) [Commensalibacter papalotli (ex Botero et al. 2024)]CAI3938905.1 Glutamate racemase (MurI) (PDB:1B73) [Commensalibacter papalotli (ex Botero et al. 2024)]
MSYHILAFDSGIGGIGIVRSLFEQAQQTNLNLSIDYLADNLVFPYGEQEDNFLIQRIITLIGKAIDKLEPDLVIIACNTASTIALQALREHYPNTEFVGCVPPIRWAARISQTKHIGLLATRATVQRPYLKSLKEQFAADCQLIGYGSPILAKIAEQIFRQESYNPENIAQEIHALLSMPSAEQIDTVCLGCTHYTFVLPHLQELSPRHIQWLDPANAVAKHALDLIAAKTITPNNNTPRTNRFYYTALPNEDKALLEQITYMGYTKLRHFQSQK